MTAQEYIRMAENTISEHFNKTFKPLIKGEAKRLKIKKIEDIMGVTFYTLNNGKTFSDSEFEESSLVRKEFADKYINPFKSDWCYSLIDTDI